MPSQDAPGLLVVATEVEPGAEAEWNRWYDNRHVPQLLTVPGFLRARRYTAVEGIDGTRPYLALYDLASAAVLTSDAYLALRQPPQRTEEDRMMLRRFKASFRLEMTQINPPVTAPPEPPAFGALLVVGLDPEPAYEEEYNAWYDEEHLPGLLPVPGVLRARRFRALDGSPRYLAVYELAAADVRHSASFERAIDTPWSTRMRRHCTRAVTAIYRPR